LEQKRPAGPDDIVGPTRRLPDQTRARPPTLADTGSGNAKTSDYLK
jgi:hypothetical protein